MNGSTPIVDFLARRPHSRSVFLVLLAFLAAFSPSCGGTEKQPETVARLRGWQFERGATPGQARAAFVPKGAYIVGLRDDTQYPLNAWLRLVPGDLWPREEPAPSLLAGRVAERQKSAARIEILSFQPGMRETRPGFETYPAQAEPAESLHAITKRLAFAAGPTQNDTVQTTMNRAALVQGNELYGAFDLSAAHRNDRLANANMALMTVSPNSDGDSVRLVRTAGTLPENPAFVLLDAPMRPAFDINIQVDDVPHRAEILEHLKSILTVPGSEFIRISKASRPPDIDKTIASLGKTQTESLDVVLTRHKKTPVLLDQALRVTDSPFTVVLTEDDARLEAAAAAARALEMLGYPSSGAFILEKIWSESTSARRKAAITPSLASLYHRMERDDWALEAGLEILEMSRTQAKSAKRELQAAAAAAFAMIGRADEFAWLYDDVHDAVPSLSDAWKKVFAHTMLVAQTIPRYHEYFTSARKPWNEFDQMLECYYADHDEPCRDGADQAQTDFGRLWFSTMSAANSSLSARQLDLAKKIDDIGAPNLAMHHWANMLSNGLSAESSPSAWLNMALYARRAQQIRTYLHLMFSYMIQQKSLDTDAASEAVAGWKSLDWRAELAYSCVIRAESASSGESVDLLNLAAELYISTGDSENAAIIYSKLANLYAESGQNDRSDAYRLRAKSFSQNTRRPEVLNAVRGDQNDAKQ